MTFGGFRRLTTVTPCILISIMVNVFKALLNPFNLHPIHIADVFER